jgi:hypothetical protein
MQRPNTLLGLSRRLVSTRWQSLSPRGKKLSVVAAVLFGAAALVGARSIACCASGCPYQEQQVAPADTGGCPHARR